MGFSVDYDELPENTGDFAMEGRHHFLVTKVVEDGNDKGDMIVDLLVVGSADKSQINRTHREYFSQSSKAKKRAVIFAIATGLTSVEEIEAARKGQRTIELPFNLARRRHFCGELLAEEYQGTKRNKLGFRMWHITSAEAKTCGFNKKALEETADAEASPFGDAPNEPPPPAESGDSAMDDIFN